MIDQRLSWPVLPSGSRQHPRSTASSSKRSCLAKHLWEQLLRSRRQLPARAAPQCQRTRSRRLCAERWNTVLGADVPADQPLMQAGLDSLGAGCMQPLTFSRRLNNAEAV